ncbi:MAG: endosialidase [Lachnospiraceae bacterium]|nr:endosialidase [Lachnospiraceae bacterium]
MSAVDELIKTEGDGSLSFGNHVLQAKSKKEDYKHGGDLYKVKTFKDITKLEKNGLFVYESVPGTSVNYFSQTEEGVSFTVEGTDDAQITVGLAEDTEYEVIVGDRNAGIMKTNLGGKLSISVELAGEGEVELKIKKV